MPRDYAQHVTSIEVDGIEGSRFVSTHTARHLFDIIPDYTPQGMQRATTRALPHAHGEICEPCWLKQAVIHGANVYNMYHDYDG